MKHIDQANYKLTGEIEPPIYVPYNVFLFNKKETIVTGELRKVEYYRNYTPATQGNPEEYSDLILVEHRAYTRDALGLVVYRIMTIEWYLEDDTIGHTMVSEPKYYNTKDSFEEAETRRKNIMSEAKLYVFGAFAAQVGEQDGITAALDLMSVLNNEIQLYFQGQIDSLITALQNSTEPLLTTQIKTDVLAILNFQ